MDLLIQEFVVYSTFPVSSTQDNMDTVYAYYSFLPEKGKQIKLFASLHQFFFIKTKTAENICVPRQDTEIFKLQQ